MIIAYQSHRKILNKFINKIMLYVRRINCDHEWLKTVIHITLVNHYLYTVRHFIKSTLLSDENIFFRKRARAHGGGAGGRGRGEERIANRLLVQH